MADYYRPILQTGPGRPRGAPRLAGGWTWFERVEHLRRDAPPETRPVSSLPTDLLDRLTVPRAPLAGLSVDRPRIMGIVNVTPDSFSDGGDAAAPQDAIAQATAMADAVDLIDIGAESTRPGAETIPPTQEIARLDPVLSALSATHAVSVDTRKSDVAAMALAGGAVLINDVSGLDYDPDMAATVAASEAALCLMHSPSGPETMMQNAAYGNVLLDVYDALEARVARAEAAGIPRARVAIDPGIGFGKTQDHNLAILARVSLFHGLGCVVLVGASRKRFIGTIGGAPAPKDRMPGSVAVALHAAAQGVQILRVHDTAATAQAFRLATALRLGATA